MSKDIQDKTIQDFGEQWTLYSENDGYYGTTELFWDIFGPLLEEGDIRGRRVADIGSGTGRVANMLLMLEAAHVTAVEPSDAFDVLEKSTQSAGDRITCLKLTGDRIPAGLQLDTIVSAGVVHHIPEPDPVVRAAFEALRPGGKFAIWIYGKEGNEAYLMAAGALRAMTTRLPHGLLAALCWGLSLPLTGYSFLCRFLPLPMHRYMVNVIGRWTMYQRRLAIYDQLNPAYAKYYTRDEAHALFERNGFGNIRLNHRHGYSWTVVGEKPAAT